MKELQTEGEVLSWMWICSTKVWGEKHRSENDNNCSCSIKNISSWWNPAASPATSRTAEFNVSCNWRAIAITRVPTACVCVCVCWNDCVALDVQPPGSKLGLAWCCDGRGEAALWTCTFNLGDLLICHIVRADEPQHSCMRLQVIGQRRPVCGSLVALLSPPSGNTMSIIPATLHQFSQNAHDYARFSCQRIKVRPFQRI